MDIEKYMDMATLWVSTYALKIVGAIVILIIGRWLAKRLTKLLARVMKKNNVDETLVGFMESYAVAKVYARRNRYTVEPNRELVGLGAANVASGLFGGYPVTGGFSRTAVNDTAGARTPLASLITAVYSGLGSSEREAFLIMPSRFGRFSSGSPGPIPPPNS